MSVGIAVDKTHIDNSSGQITRSLNQIFYQVGDLARLLSATPTEDLQAMGYSADEAYLLQVAFQDLALLRQIWLGEVALADAKDFTANASKLWGTGW
jgi:hypothetical protein